MGDWIFDHIGYFILALLALLFTALLVSASNSEKEKQAFIAECLADGKKKYECEALWRSGEPSVIPVFIPMPSGR